MKFSDELRRLSSAATAGKWAVECYEKSCHYKGVITDGYSISGPTYMPDYENPKLCESDAALIVYLRNHCDAIAKLVEAAEKANCVERSSMRTLRECVADLNKED